MGRCIKEITGYGRILKEMLTNWGFLPTPAASVPDGLTLVGDAVAIERELVPREESLDSDAGGSEPSV